MKMKALNLTGVFSWLEIPKHRDKLHSRYERLRGTSSPPTHLSGVARRLADVAGWIIPRSMRGSPAFGGVQFIAFPS